MKQFELGFIKNQKSAKCFGGELLTNKRKSKRPLSPNLPLHLVLRSTSKIVFSPHNFRLEKLIHQIANESNIRIYEFAINWSHLHFVILAKTREDYNYFVRVLSSKLAMAIQKSQTIKAKKLFALRPFTRILTWGRDFKNARAYMILNQKESRGEIKREKKVKSKIQLKQTGRPSGPSCKYPKTKITGGLWCAMKVTIERPHTSLKRPTKRPPTLSTSPDQSPDC